MEEIWKPIDYQGIIYHYEVSTWGRVRNKTTKHILAERISTHGYLEVHLCHEGTDKFIKIHRLVANAFIPNPDNLPEVDHINGNKLDNRVENLQWITHQANIDKADHTKKRRRVLCIETGVIYDSITQASKQTGVSTTQIHKHCNGQIKGKFIKRGKTILHFKYVD